MDGYAYECSNGLASDDSGCKEVGSVTGRTYFSSESWRQVYTSEIDARTFPAFSRIPSSCSCLVCALELRLGMTGALVIQHVGIVL